MISLDSKAMYEIEKNAWDEGYKQEDAMNIAAQGIVNRLEEKIGNLHSQRLLFVCGSGNNGADGFTAAFFAAKAGAKADVLIAKEPREALAVGRLEALKKIPVNIFSFDEQGQGYFLDKRSFGAQKNEFSPVQIELDSYAVIIDCIFGIGFKGELQGQMLDLVKKINSSRAIRISCDIPSGMEAGSASFSSYVKADETISMGFCKDCLMFAGKDRAGDIIIKEIPFFSTEKIDRTDIKFIVQTKSEALKMLPDKKSFFHKGNSGHLGLFVGSEGMAGAGIIAGRAAMKSGLALASYIEPKGNAAIYQSANPHMMLKSLDDLDIFTAIGAGCGLGMNRQKELFELIEGAKCPLVLDADALNLLAKSPMKLGKTRAITPHILECARLLNCDRQEVLKAPFDAVKRLYEKYECLILLKNNASICYDGERFIVNALEAKSLAKAGSGDCLLGLLSGIIAQKSPQNRSSFDFNMENRLITPDISEYKRIRYSENSRLSEIKNRISNKTNSPKNSEINTEIYNETNIKTADISNNPPLEFESESPANSEISLKSLALASLWLSLAGNHAHEKQGISANALDLLDSLGLCLK